MSPFLGGNINFRIRATELKNLDAINKAVHDRWFKVDDVKLDASRNTLSVPFGDSRSATRKPGGATISHYLEIGYVERYTLEETEGVGSYDFNEIRFVQPTQTVTITTGIPLTFEIVVKKLDVRVLNGRREKV